MPRPGAIFAGLAGISGFRLLLAENIANNAAQQSLCATGVSAMCLSAASR
ncbi:hypothetical protein KCP74_13810 [Salmonella enterica subsp. enterica]|nr:hypothetical protein KCP74_13810 [Salmonella enterica subsp. enterica]